MEVTNNKKLYQDITYKLAFHGACLIGWSDERGTHLDILFSTIAPFKSLGECRRGIRASYLFVSVMGVGAFGFDVSDHKTHPSYYSEKLNLGWSSQEVADLINGVKKSLSEFKLADTWSPQ